MKHCQSFTNPIYLMPLMLVLLFSNTCSGAQARVETLFLSPFSELDDGLSASTAPLQKAENKPDWNATLTPSEKPSTLPSAAADASAAADTSPSASITQPSSLAAGSKFPVIIDRTVTSKTAHIGDTVEAHLSGDMKVGGRLVATKGSMVRGHVCSVQKARKVLKAELSRHRWMKSAGALGVQLDEIVTERQEHLPLVATPARQTRFVKDMQQGRVLGINDKGEIVSPLSAQLKAQGVHWGIHIAVSAAGVAGGPIGLGVMPVAFGCLGAISPSFVFMHPVGKNMKHRRLKGFALGFVSGVPGGGFVVDAIVRGPEAIIEPGDIFDVELKKEFIGEPAMVAQKEEVHDVHGEVLLQEQSPMVTQ